MTRVSKDGLDHLLPNDALANSQINAVKITTDACKAAIVEWCKTNPQHINQQFVDPLSSEKLAMTEKVSNWIRIQKRKTPQGVLREFDCKPFDDQLRASILTNLGDTKIISHIKNKCV